MSFSQHLKRAVVPGALAGALSLALDLLLARITLGYQIPGFLGYGLWYLGAGVVFSGLIYLVRSQPTPQEVFSGALALMYLPPLIERVFGSLSYRFPMVGVIAAIAAILVMFGAWLVVLRRIIKPDDRWWAMILAAVTIAVGLAVNRNMVDYPLETAALALDGMVVFAILAIAFISRRFGPGGGALSIAGGVLLLAAAVAVFGRASPPAHDAAVEPGTPNLVVIIIDTIRQDVFESVVTETDEGRRFRAAFDDSAWFSNGVAAAPWTAPSVGSIMTGLYPGEHGFGRRTKDPSRPLHRLRASVPTIAELLSARGYDTIGIVTNSLLQQASGINRGFSYYRLLHAGADKLPLMTVAVRLGWHRRELYQSAESMRSHLEGQVDRLARSDRPFFLWMHLMDPHAPLRAHPELEIEPASERLPDSDRLYRDEVRYVLSETALMIDLLENTVDWDQTVVVVVGDHGEMFPSDRRTTTVKTRGGGPMLQGHGHALYDELVHVPLVIRPAAGIDTSRDVDAVASHVDLASTIFDLLGGEPFPGPTDRYSLAPQISSASPEGGASRTGVFSGATQRGPLQFSYRSKDLKVIHYPNGDQDPEVFDLVKDPGETMNLGRGGHLFANEIIAAIEQHAAAMGAIESSEAISFDPETRQRLEALGYLGGGETE